MGICSVIYYVENIIPRDASVWLQLFGQTGIKAAYNIPWLHWKGMLLLSVLGDGNNY